MSKIILGISAFYHDSAAVVLSDGDIIAAAQEERFTRNKHDSNFPVNAISYVLQETGIPIDRLSAVAFYDKPFLKFERLLETYHGFAPKGLSSFLSAIPVWIKEKLFLKRLLKQELSKFGKIDHIKIMFPEHHLSHAASAFYPSPFSEAAIITVDGVGEWATTTIGYGSGSEISVFKQLDFPHSLGLLYSAFTHYCGFKVNSGEYKLMGLAPYGNIKSRQVTEWKQAVLQEMLDLREDGSFLLNMEYFNYATGLTMCVDSKWENLFKVPRREPESKISQEYMNLALVVQQVTEKVILKLAKTAQEYTQSEHLVMSGGVALNCVANGKLLKKGIFKEIWIQPAAGDAGGALGAAYAVWHIWMEQNRNNHTGSDSMKGSYLGPSFDRNDVIRLMRKYNTKAECYSDFGNLCAHVTDLLSNGNVVGWFQGRMEYGPRALGNRSILGDARNSEMQKKLNLQIKYREGFRPFAPSVLEEDISEYFDLDRPSPYMLLVAPVKQERRKWIPPDYEALPLYERLYHQRSDIPAITHVDFSARIQSVNKNMNDRYWQLINTFKEKTGYAILVNTSFNVRGEPIVCTVEDAYLCFLKTQMDFLVIENFLFAREDQPPMNK